MRRLVLFDIDGTLIYHLKSVRRTGFARFKYAIDKVFGVDAKIDESVNYNGWVDRQIVWFIIKPYGISREEFKQKFSKVSKALHEFAVNQAANGDQLYAAIPEAVNLAKLLQKQKGTRLGVMTGNVEKMAWWKLDHAKIGEIFSFGLFGDEVDDRIDLAKTVFAKTQKHFHTVFSPTDVFVIGDAVGDVRCGKAIGATTIIVTTGGHSPRELLDREKPDLLVDSLMDKKVLDLFNLSKG